MTKLIKDILPLGAGIGAFTKLDFGMDESDWRAAEGKSGSYIIGWWEGKAGSVAFPETAADEAVWLVEGRIVKGMTSADVRERAATMCGAVGDEAVVCFHPDLSMPDTERWETLLTVGIDTDACALDYVAGNPHDLARDGFQRF